MLTLRKVSSGRKKSEYVEISTVYIPGKSPNPPLSGDPPTMASIKKDSPENSSPQSGSAIGAGNASSNQRPTKVNGPEQQNSHTQQTTEEDSTPHYSDIGRIIAAKKLYYRASREAPPVMQMTSPNPATDVKPSRTPVRSQSFDKLVTLEKQQQQQQAAPQQFSDKPSSNTPKRTSESAWSASPLPKFDIGSKAVFIKERGKTITASTIKKIKENVMNSLPPKLTEATLMRKGRTIEGHVLVSKGKVWKKWLMILSSGKLEFWKEGEKKMEMVLYSVQCHRRSSEGEIVFEVITSEQAMLLQVFSEQEMKDWMEEIMKQRIEGTAARAKAISLPPALDVEEYKRRMIEKYQREQQDNQRLLMAKKQEGKVPRVTQRQRQQQTQIQNDSEGSVSLTKKLAIISQDIEQVKKEIEGLNQAKVQAAEREEYVQAASYKQKVAEKMQLLERLKKEQHLMQQLLLQAKQKEKQEQQQQIEELQKQIAELTKKKQQAVAVEDFIAASEYKKQITELEGKLKLLRS